MRLLLTVTAALLAATPGGTLAQDQGEAVRVMTFNIRYGTAPDGDNAWPLRRTLVFDTIREAAPEVVGVQEALAFQLDEIQQALPHFRRVGVGRDDGVAAGEFSAILVDATRFEVLDEGTFWFSDTPSEPGSTSWGNRIPRICSWVRLRDRGAGGDGSFYVFNVHWDHESQPSRERSADLLVAHVAGRGAPADPALITGDFNAGESNPAFRRVVAAGFRDTFRTLHPSTSGAGTFNGFVGDRTGDKIDAILVSPGWTVLDAAIVRTNRDGRYPSDHFPVTATLRRSR